MNGLKKKNVINEIIKVNDDIGKLIKMFIIRVDEFTK
jgi:hypothetical protein